LGNCWPPRNLVERAHRLGPTSWAA